MKKPLSGEPTIIEPGCARVIICCDCGLAHTYFYRLRKIRGKLRIEEVGYRDDYETMLARKKSATKSNTLDKEKK